MSDFQDSCKDFIGKHEKEANGLKEIIEKSEFALKLLPDVEEIEHKLKQNQLKIEEFMSKIAENEQDSIKYDLQVESQNKRRNNDIAELNQAIVYLRKLVKTDKDHIEEILNRVISIKAAIEADETNHEAGVTQDHFYEPVLNDLQIDKSVLESKITQIQQERRQIENYLQLITPQLASVSMLITSKSLLCDAQSSLKTPLLTITKLISS
jgi:chromosome segregation ATPase